MAVSLAVGGGINQLFALRAGIAILLRIINKLFLLERIGVLVWTTIADDRGEAQLQGQVANGAVK
ncbi:hypothetical protein Xszus_02786 [Xenorhabdus szentirmaii]|nr:hypothetical protein Xsze_00703 [Xenorhabdus szentirmaii DSM 16338]PHM43013.1 hypothetical protein Xszus_02786 [Xenorhabdus szentirmaii]